MKLTVHILQVLIRQVQGMAAETIILRIMSHGMMLSFTVTRGVWLKASLPATRLMEKQILLNGEMFLQSEMQHGIL